MEDSCFVFQKCLRADSGPWIGGVDRGKSSEFANMRNYIPSILHVKSITLTFFHIALIACFLVSSEFQSFLLLRFRPY